MFLLGMNCSLPPEFNEAISTTKRRVFFQLFPHRRIKGERPRIGVGTRLIEAEAEIVNSAGTGLVRPLPPLPQMPPHHRNNQVPPLVQPGRRAADADAEAGAGIVAGDQHGDDVGARRHAAAAFGVALGADDLDIVEELVLRHALLGRLGVGVVATDDGAGRSAMGSPLKKASPSPTRSGARLLLD